MNIYTFYIRENAETSFWPLKKLKLFCVGLGRWDTLSDTACAARVFLHLARSEVAHFLTKFYGQVIVERMEGDATAEVLICKPIYLRPSQGPL